MIAKKKNHHVSSPKKSGKKLTPRLIALIYAVVGGLWILASDRVVNMISDNPDIITDLQTYKGWIYILATAMMLYCLISSYGARLLEAMNTLRKSEERNRLLVESVTDYEIFAVDPSGRITSWNTGAERSKGYTSEEIIGKSHAIFFTEGDIKRGAPESELNIAAEKGRLEGQGWRVRKDGSLFWAEVVTTAMRDEQGKLYGFSKVIRDISERRRIEKALEESEARFRTLVEQSPFSMVIYRPDGSIITFNEAARALWGVTNENAERAVMDYNILKDEQLEAAGLIPYVREGFEGRFAEIPAIKYDRERILGDRSAGLKEIWVKGYIYPVKDETGKVLQVVLMHEDITESKQAEEALLDSQRETAFLADLVEHSSQPFACAYPDGRLMRVNTAFSRLTGYTKEELADIDWAHVLTPREWHEYERAKLEELASTGRSVRYEKEYIRKDGSRVPVEILGNIVKNGQGTIRYYFAFVTDITERKRAEEAIKESRERFRSLVEATSDWVWELDENAVYTYSSTKVHDILGYKPEEVLGKTPFDLMPPDEARRVAALFREMAASRKPFSLLENINRHKEGRPVVLETSGVPFFDSSGNFKGYRGIDRDITERKHAEETIRYQTYHDLLTGLPNKPHFMDLLGHEISQMQGMGKRLAVLFLDVDQFKNVNDSLGHAAGDALIQHIAARLKNRLRDFDTIARIGGDEFTILLTLIAQPEDVSGIAEKIMESFAKPFIIHNNELHITASIGISLYPDDAEDAESLIKASDIALHYAKGQGRNNFQFFNASLNIRTLERILFENRLRHAVERGELVVYYQPQQDIKTRQLTGVEALVRWNHPELGVLAPAQFISLAEEIGLIIQVDQWVLRAACKQAKEWEKAGYGAVCVTTNLSARQFQQPNLAGIISDILKETGLPPHCLGIEITETLAMQDTELTASNLDKLNAMGVRLVIDDFGTGYSSLSYLKRLPIHKLKIDKSFIISVTRDRDDQAIINAIIAMAHILKLKVVAEGVETEDQVSFLNSRDCDEMQGFLSSRPVPAREIEKMLVSVSDNRDPER